MMWQEARKQEKKIRGMLVDYKRRAERRKDYYEKIKAEPTQFIQLHGRPCKIHLDPAVAIAGDSPANMMSWQGNHNILIDRFDVRAHLDYIPDAKPNNDEDEELTSDDRYINYERYRILAQNDFLGVTEDKFLHQLNVEEQFGPVEKIEQPIEGKKKVVGAAIGYNYNEGPSVPACAGEPARVDKNKSDDDNEDDEEDDDDSDIDFDLCVDVNKISSAQAHEMNASALVYGMMSNDFFSFLTKDVEEAENLKIAREREEEKAMFSGRKSRRERRAFREKKLLGRKLSPPSYAASKNAPIADLIRTVSKSRSRTRSRSASPPNAGMIQYITSFGNEENPLEPPPPQIIKTSVHTSKEEDNVYKRTVRYRSSRSPESTRRRGNSGSLERSQRSWSKDKRHSPDTSRRSRSQSPIWRSRSPATRTVRYRSRSRSPAHHSRAKSPLSSRGNDKIRNSKEYDRFSGPSYRRRQSVSRSKSPNPPPRIVKKSVSPQPVRSIEVPAPPVITRYYGRHNNKSSSSELDLSDSEDKNDQTTDRISAPDKNNQAVGNSGGRTKPAAAALAAKVSLQERLKKKRQALINRQYKADKRAERLRQEKAEQERQDREDEMREISIKMRRRERQKRHQYYELDESNAAENSDDDELLSTVSSASGSDKLGSDPEQRTRRPPKKVRDEDVDRSRNSKERDRSRGRDSKKDTERSEDRERRYRKGRDEERSRGRDRSRERIRERPRRDRDRSRDRGRDRSRDRERYSGRRSREREHSEESGVSIKKPIKPLVDY